MPEGDVLRRTAAHLDRALAGRRLVRADLRWPTAATVDLVGRTVLGTRPYGKHLLTRFDDGRTLHTHLRMDGTWRLVPSVERRAAARSPQVRAVLADERLLKQMLMNLLSNAVKFTPAGGTVTVRAARLEDGGLAISVADTGAGIAPEVLERVFSPFVQAGGDLSRGHEGAGLGLPLTKALVEQHDGRIVLDSAPGRGTVATLLLPAGRVLGRKAQALPG